MQIDIPPGTKVMVTGATGYTGKVLVEKLIQAGLVVNAVARKTSDISIFKGKPINWVRGDVFDETTIGTAMEGADFAFHVAAAFREAKSSKEDYWNVHVKSTQLIVEHAQKNKNFKRLVQVSTMGVHGHIENPPADEYSDFRPGDEYQSTKAEAEVWLREYAAQNSFPYSIIRPCAIYGPGERRLLKLFKMATRRYFPILGQGKCWYHLVHVEDLANAIILAATKERALGEPFLIGSSDPIKLEDMAHIIAREYNKKVHIIRLPITPFFILGDLCEAICKPLKIEPPIYRRRVAFYSKDRNFSTKKMREVLGYTPLHENEAGIIESAKWYRDNGWLQVGN